MPNSAVTVICIANISAKYISTKFQNSTLDFVLGFTSIYGMAEAGI